MLNNLSNLEKIKSQLDLLKVKLDNLDKTLKTQERILNLLDEDSSGFFNLLTKVEKKQEQKASIENIMKNAFSSKKLPKILFK